MVLLLSGLVLLTLARTSSAAPMVPNCPSGITDVSGNPAITFGGSGIPTNAVCAGNAQGIDLVLSITPRLDNPAVTNDGLNTFFCGAGGDSGHAQSDYGLCNFDFYAKNNTQSNVTATLSWDTDPSSSNDISSFGYLSFLLAPGATVQDSWNLGMAFIDTGVCASGYCPAASLFDPNVSGLYGFQFAIMGPEGAPFGSIGINEQVGDLQPVPEPGTIALLGVGLACIGMAMRRRRMPQATPV